MATAVVSVIGAVGVGKSSMCRALDKYIPSATRRADRPVHWKGIHTNTAVSKNVVQQYINCILTQDLVEAYIDMNDQNKVMILDRHPLEVTHIFNEKAVADGSLSRDVADRMKCGVINLLRDLKKDAEKKSVLVYIHIDDSIMLRRIHARGSSNSTVAWTDVDYLDVNKRYEDCAHLFAPFFDHVIHVDNNSDGETRAKDVVCKIRDFVFKNC